jgi:cysteine-rich repeat protein
VRRRHLTAVALLGLASGFSAPHAFAAATFTIVNLDEGTGQGLDDPTPATPVGGNLGTTLGAQRLNAFQHALDIWGEVLTSTQPIEVSITFRDLSGGDCSGFSVVLGQAGASDLAQAASAVTGNDTTWHPIALANSLEGMDLDPSIPDLDAEFNSALDEGCIPGLKWYYGFDGQSGTDEDFIPTALHELGHGLGFASYTQGGAWVYGSPDIFGHWQYDLTAQKAWDEMTEGERAASSVNPRGLVWSGPNVKREAAKFLDPGSPTITLTPAVNGLSGRLSEQVTGPRLAAAGVTGTLVVASPISGCEPPTNASAVAGNIVLVDPFQGGGECSPLQAQVYMELAGAKAVLSVDPQGTDPPTPIYGEYGPDFPDPQKVPIFAVTVGDGALLEGAAGASITLSATPAQLVGANSAGQIYLFTPSVTQGGSSVSHWDTFARHNLLMEPSSSPDVKATDVTRFLMQDLGWGICGDGQKQGDEECDDGNAVDMDGCTPSCTPEVCGDGDVNQTIEECDDGNTVAMDGCGPTCKDEVCGDGTVNQASEKCDDGNQVDGDGCSAACIQEICGDGQKQGAEACDDGNMVAKDGCESDCTVSPGFQPGSGGSGSGGNGSGAGSGAGAANDEEEESSGCLCQAAGRRTSPVGALGWLSAALVLVGARRRGVSRARTLRA